MLVVENLLSVEVTCKISGLYVEGVVVAYYFVTDGTHFVIVYAVSMLTHRAVNVIVASAGAFVGWIGVVHSN